MNDHMRYPLYQKHPDPLELVAAEPPAEPDQILGYVEMDTRGVVPYDRDPADVKITFNLPHGFTTDWVNVERMLHAMRRQFREAGGIER